MHNKILILSLTALLPLTAQALSYSFEVNSEDASQGLVVSGSIDFFSNTGYIDVNLFNEPGTSSYVSGIYFLKPSTLVDVPSLEVAPADWNLATDFDKGVVGGPLGKLGTMSAEDAFDNYFGAVTGPKNPSLKSGEQAFFSWEADASFDPETQSWSIYGNSANPHVIVRWQSVGEDGEDSARGYAFIDLTVTPVPEPSQIAGLSILALGGVLLLRRRIVRRKNNS